MSIWSKVIENEFIFEDKCWNTCGGGFCCNTVHPDFDFKLMPKSGTTIFYFGDEYDWIQQNGKTHQNEGLGAKPNFFEIPLSEEETLKCYYTPCLLLGRCNDVVDKPLHCRLYPFTPVPSIDGGTLEDCTYASIFDLTFKILEAPQICTVVAKKDQYFDQFSKSPLIQEIIMDPKIRIGLRAVKYFNDSYAETLMSNSTLMGKKGKDFWSYWEMLYLTQQLFDKNKIQQKVKEDYAQIKSLQKI